MPGVHVQLGRSHSDETGFRRQESRSPSCAADIYVQPRDPRSFHPRWAMMQLGITLALWAVVIVGLKLLVSSL
jgi:hypothetical protein